MNHFSDLVGILLKIYSYWRSAKIDQFTQLKSQTDRLQAPSHTFNQCSQDIFHVQVAQLVVHNGPDWGFLPSQPALEPFLNYIYFTSFHVQNIPKRPSYFQFDQFIPAGSVEGTQLRVDEPLNPTLKATFNFDIGAEIHHICFLSF